MSKALILFLLTLFWLPASCAILPEKKYVEVKMSEPKSQPEKRSVKKGECHLRIKNFSLSEIVICLNGPELGRIGAKSEKIFFNCLDCQGGQISIVAGKILLIGDNLLTLQNSDLPWLGKPLKGNLWTILVCPDLTIPGLSKGRCQ